MNRLLIDRLGYIRRTTDNPLRGSFRFTMIPFMSLFFNTSNIGPLVKILLGLSI